MLEGTAEKDVSEKHGENSAAPLRKIWLPKLVYDLLPYFYVGAGLLALLATVYINHWVWVVPHYVLFSAACIHLGFMVFRRRVSGRNKD